jgi:hypothetical protein
MFLDVNDEFLGGAMPVGRIGFARPKITVRELIHERVRLELEREAERRRSRDNVAIPITAEEARLNLAERPSPLAAAIFEDGDAPGTAGKVRIAEQAFADGRYFVLLDDRQADDLDEVIDLAATSQATFLMLTPLKGG